MKKVLLLFAFCLSVSTLLGQSVLMNNLWDTDGEIYDSEIIGNNIYVTGKFNMVFPVTGPSALISTENGEIVGGGQLNFNGKVNVTIPDGNGGHYIAGDFTQVNGNPRPRICQVDAQRNLLPFSPNISGSNITNLFLHDNKLIMRGSVYLEHDWRNSGFLVCHLETGQLDRSFVYDNHIDGLLSSGSGYKVHDNYVYFSTGNSQIQYLCRFNPNDSVPTIESIEVRGGTHEVVSNILFRNDTAFVLGNFTQVGDALRNNTAAINTNTFRVLPWYPNANGRISSAALYGNKLFVCGSFTSIGGRPLNRFAAIDVQTSLALDWYPNATNSEGGNFSSGVSEVFLDQNKLYLINNFYDSNRQSRSKLGRINLPDLALDNWFILADGHVSHIEKIAPNVLFTSGTFNKIGGKFRSNFACLNLETGTVQPIIANLNNTGTDILRDGDNEIFISGSFSSVNGVARNKMAKIDFNNGSLLPFNLTSNITTNADRIEIGTYLYVFTNRGIVAVDRFTGNSTGWTITPSGGPTNPHQPNNTSIFAAKELNGKLYVGGSFSALNNETVNHIAAFDVSTRQKTSWNVQPNDQVNDIEVYNGKLLVAGEFFNIGLRPRNYFAELDPNSEIATNTVANADASISDIALNNNLLYLFGRFTIFADTRFTTNIAPFDLINKQAGTWRSPVGFNGSYNISSSRNLVAITKRVFQSWNTTERYLQVFRNDPDLTLNAKSDIITSGITLFPNPAKDKVALQLPADKMGSSGTINLYSMNGALMQSNTFNATETEISLTEFKSGLYLYKVILDNGTQYSGKVIKE